MLPGEFGRWRLILAASEVSSGKVRPLIRVVLCSRLVTVTLVGLRWAAAAVVAVVLKFGVVTSLVVVVVAGVWRLVLLVLVCGRRAGALVYVVSTEVTSRAATWGRVVGTGGSFCLWVAECG